MRMVRRTSVLLVGALVAAGAAMLPANAANGPTTLAVAGTIQVVVVDHFGTETSGGARAEHLYRVVTDDGAEIPVDLEEDTPANGRFSGELVVEGEVASTLDDKELLPRAGSTIAEDTRAGRAAVAVAEKQETPLQVTESAVTASAVSAAVAASAPHKAYVAVLDNRGSVEESDTQVKAIVNEITGYWKTESGGTITMFDVQGAVEHFNTATSTSVTGTDQNCGMDDPYDIWNEAALRFTSRPSVFFGPSSRNHLIVAMADECGEGASGTAGVAEVGTDLSSGGPMSLSMGSIDTQVGVHELGHTFGLGHANVDQCPTPSTCATGEYFDLFSPMALAVGGPFRSPALDAAFRARLGVVAPGEFSQVTAGTVTIAPRSTTTGLRGVEVPDPGTGARYYIEYRSGTDRDLSSFYASPYSLTGVPVAYDPGVTVTTVSPGGVLTLQSQKASLPYAGALSQGQSFVSPSGTTRVDVGAIAAGGATVTVTSSSPAPVAPVPGKFTTRTPKISGTVKVGKTLKVKVRSWTPRPSFTYQWFANGRKISTKGTKSSLRLTTKQKGKRITVKVTARKAGYTTITKSSKKTKKVAKK